MTPPHPAIAFAALVLLGGCGTATEATMPAETAVVPTIAPFTTEQQAVLTQAEIKLPIDTAPLTTALRVDPPTTTTPPDPCGPEAVAYVNGLAYSWQNQVPTTESYNIITFCLGWDQATIDKWRAGIIGDLITKESAHCPLNSGGSLVNMDCSIRKRGTGSDTGLGQLISLWYDSDGYLCVNFGYCGQQSILASPWDSMRALLLVVMYDGKGPWCYSDWARDYHKAMCSTLPRYWP